MNLQKLFKAQKPLDDHIVKEKGLEGQDLLDKKILALQVELGELANEWEMFKFWKDNPEPRIESWRCVVCGYEEDENIDCINVDLDNHYDSWNEMVNPLLEEYVDCLHFILSIGLEKGLNNLILDYRAKENEITRLFIQINLGAATLLHFEGDHKKNYRVMVGQFIKLGEMLGFTWEQIEQAYFAKNKINFERQENGY